MKTINQYRQTNQFNISSVHVAHLALIHETYGSRLIGVANIPGDSVSHYIIRVIDKHDHRSTMTDIHISVVCDIRELEREVIHTWGDTQVA